MGASRATSAGNRVVPAAPSSVAVCNADVLLHVSQQRCVAVVGAAAWEALPLRRLLQLHARRGRGRPGRRLEYVLCAGGWRVRGTVNALRLRSVEEAHSSLNYTGCGNLPPICIALAPTSPAASPPAQLRTSFCSTATARRGGMASG